MENYDHPLTEHLIDLGSITEATKGPIAPVGETIGLFVPIGLTVD